MHPRSTQSSLRFVLLAGFFVGQDFLSFNFRIRCLQDSVSGIKSGVGAGMPVVGVTTRNPEKLLRDAGASLLIKDYEDPKLWAGLEAVEKASSNGVVHDT
ncbi:hypothetical protein KSP40_PGU019488 [Platanthera guangdongensis]|uniref:Uncharacterized protein n=1 Tax=Platanthera guangdongensis TaxID=2320717 RepID=A0ABR2MK86_9ASPA